MPKFFYKAAPNSVSTKTVYIQFTFLISASGPKYHTFLFESG